MYLDCATFDQISINRAMAHLIGASLDKVYNLDLPMNRNSYEMLETARMNDMKYEFISKQAFTKASNTRYYQFHCLN